MATGERLTANIDPWMAQAIEDVADDRANGKYPEAQRIILKEGLESLGYVDQPADATELFVYYIRRIGLILGLVGLIMIGYGIFGSLQWRVIGFGLLLGGFLFLVLEEGIKYNERRTAPTDPVRQPESA